MRIEFLEDRSVPAATGTDVAVPDAPITEPEVLVIQDETEPTDGEIVTLNSPLDGEPEDTAVDLAAFATVNKLKPSIGDVVTVRAAVVNNGDVPATGTVMTLTLPTGLTFVSAQPGQGSFDRDTGIWTAGTVFPGGPVSMVIKAKVIDPVARCSGRDGIAPGGSARSGYGEQRCRATVTPILAGIKISQTVSAPTLVIGATVVFTLAVKNTGPGMARNVAIKEVLGPGLTYVRAQVPSMGSFNAANRTWNIAALPTGSTATLRIVATVGKSGRLESTATVSGTGIDDTRSTLSSVGVVTGTKVNTPSPGHTRHLRSSRGRCPCPSLRRARNSPLLRRQFWWRIACSSRELSCRNSEFRVVAFLSLPSSAFGLWRAAITWASASRISADRAERQSHRAS